MGGINELIKMLGSAYASGSPSDYPNKWAAQRKTELNPQEQIPTATPTDSMSLINPYYTREHPQNNVDPLQMYRQYKQTGEMPQMQSSFTPYTPPDKQYSQVQVNAAPSVKQNPTGGK